MKLTDEQKLQIFCAALQACIAKYDGHSGAAYEAHMYTASAIEEIEKYSFEEKRDPDYASMKPL